MTHDTAVTHAAFQQTRVFSGLDGLRCLCILAVVWHHYDIPSVSALLPPARYGFLGVDLFFEISGFLIVTLLLRERERSSQISLRKFYARRALRIFPLYFLVLAVYALYFTLPNQKTSDAAQHFFSDLPALLLYLTNWIPAYGIFALTWSLAAEEQFYLLWPPVERWFKERALLLLVVLLVLSEVIQLGWVDPLLLDWFGWDPGSPRMLRETTFAPICLGVLLAHWLAQPRSFQWVNRAAGHPWAGPGYLLLLVLLTAVLPPDIRGWPRLAVHLVMLLLLASVVIREQGPLHRLLKVRIVARIGALSYGIYLLHHTAMTIVGKVLARVELLTPLTLLLLGSLVVVILAELSFRTLERPLLKWRTRLR